MVTGGLVVAAPDLEGMVMRHWWNRNWWWKSDMLGGGPSPLLLFFTTILTQTVLEINPHLTIDKPASNWVNYGMV